VEQQVAVNLIHPGPFDDHDPDLVEGLRIFGFVRYGAKTLIEASIEPVPEEMK